MINLEVPGIKSYDQRGERYSNLARFEILKLDAPVNFIYNIRGSIFCKKKMRDEGTRYYSRFKILIFLLEAIFGLKFDIIQKPEPKFLLKVRDLTQILFEVDPR